LVDLFELLETALFIWYLFTIISQIYWYVYNVNAQEKMVSFDNNNWIKSKIKYSIIADQM